MKHSIMIMLVDDDEGHRLLIQENLRAGGIVNEMVTMRDGQEALDYLCCQGAYASPPSRPRPGLILLDIKMPRVDGFGVLQRLKADPILRLIPIMMLTSTDNQAEIDRCYAMGANSYIVKPVPYEDFQQRIKALGLYLEIVQLPDCGSHA